MKHTWKKIEERKWEMKVDGIVLGTIYHKPMNDKYSVYVSTPKVFDETRRKMFVVCDTYMFNTLTDAKRGFRKLIKQKVLPWAQKVTEYAG